MVTMFSEHMVLQPWFLLLVVFSGLGFHHALILRKGTGKVLLM